jgi:hypothetical protein
MGLPIVGKLLGHSQAATTERYAHLDNDPLRKASETIAGHIAAGHGRTGRRGRRGDPAEKAGPVGTKGTRHFQKTYEPLHGRAMEPIKALRWHLAASVEPPVAISRSATTIGP